MPMSNLVRQIFGIHFCQVEWYVPAVIHLAEAHFFPLDLKKIALIKRESERRPGTHHHLSFKIVLTTTCQMRRP